MGFGGEGTLERKCARVFSANVSGNLPVTQPLQNCAQNTSLAHDPTDGTVPTGLLSHFVQAVLWIAVN